MSQIAASGTVHSVLGFRPFTPNLPHFTQLSWTPTSMATTTPRPTHQQVWPTPIRGLPVPAQSGSTSGSPAAATVMLVLLPILFGGLMLAALGLGLLQWVRQRRREKERQSGIRAARLRRATSSPFAPVPMANVVPDLEANAASGDGGSLYTTKSSEACEGRLSRAGSTRSYNLPRKPPPPYQPS
ncbi:hypothetical protein JCM3774_005420 [Rhodotorula dairenensis]